ncbi:MAG: carbon-nitrogen hydrolase [Candidatus Sumerlaeia bacterium]|nr:carbon-nitrogen hydrolase [Candidatus Sumerlaeia bacterium]
MTPRPLRVGLVQMQCGDDLADNMARACESIRRAAAEGAQVICTQELFRSRYFCQAEEHVHFDLAEPIPGPSTEMLGALARELGVVLVGSLFERRAAGVYHNTAVVIEADGSLLGTYRKMHIPDDPLYYEKFYFAPGDQGFRSWKTSRAGLGVLICWDQWFPEAARATALLGAEVLFYPTAIGWHETEKAAWGEAQHSAWETSQRAHAIANGCWVCAVNRVGREGTVEFFGQSFICDPYGRVAARGPVSDEAVIVEEIDLAMVEECRRHWPFLRDRRIDAYGGLLERFHP